MTNDEQPTAPAQEWEPIQPGRPIEFPCIAVPEDFLGTAAEAVGLAVAGAFAGLETERDEAVEALAATRQELVEGLTVLEALLEAFPESSWAHVTSVKEDAQALLDRLAPKPPT